MSARFPNNLNTSNTFPNSIYPPYGTNDNNFNRVGMPSNIYPMNGGLTGNPNGRFNGLSTNTQMLMGQNSMSNFNQAYELNQPLIEKIDYTNKNNVLHNNIGDNVLDEHVVEYRLIIDSIDRDIKIYPDPFSFVVRLNPLAKSVVQSEVNLKNGNTKLIETEFPGEPAPFITKEFVNVKYVKLENVILPQFTKTKLKKTDEGGTEVVFDPSSILITDRYIYLAIKELDNERVYTTFNTSPRVGEDGTSYTAPNPFALIIPDKILGQNYYAGTPYYGSKIYKNSMLGNLTRLSIEFYDSCGKKIEFNDIFNYEELEEYEFEHNKPLPRTDLRHPLNKRIQVTISLIIGVVESQINTQTKFEY